MHRLGSPYSHCTDGGEGVDVPLLYNATYTMQVRLGSGWGRGKGLREGGAGEREVNRPAGRQALGEGWLLPSSPWGPQPRCLAVPPGLPGLLLPATDGEHLLLRLLLLPPAGGGRVLQLRAAPVLG